MENNKNSNTVEKFLENNNMTYLFLLLANLEAERISNLPFSIKRKLQGKLTTTALEHIASNVIPDYVVEVDDDDSDEEIR
ncbi:MAG: hypothetical protein P9L97_12245 [Candidatus Tenebribacter davisii]|jgi:hypothetical protein|nr:hypothetical protein [Candidatus Tenebribacter davisii]